MATLQQRSNIDTIMTYILIKKIVQPIVRTPAYKLGLVNQSGKVLHEPNNDTERNALTVLDRLVFKLKRLLGSRIMNLNNFLYLQTLSNDFYNKLIVKGDIQQRAEILRIRKDVHGIKEKYGMSEEDLARCLLSEEVRDLEDEILTEMEEQNATGTKTS